MMTTPVLGARNLAVRRGGRELVRVEHFALAAGEVHVLLGPNGAGKTTLLRALNGLEPAAGELRFQGQPVHGARGRTRLRRHTAAVFQQPYLLSTSVKGNVESGLRLRGVRQHELRHRTEAALELLGIAHLASRRRYGLSGGEAQRVSIARALAVNPVVLFLDEPMASLDPPTRRALIADLQDIFRRLSTAVVWVTHDTEEALAVADRVTFLAEARVLQQGSTAEVFNRPAASLVADYLGIDVWLEGIVESDGEGRTRLRLPEGGWLFCPDVPLGPAFACVHPDDVVLFTTPPDESVTSARNVLPATVTSLRPVGRSTLVGLDWRGCRLDALLTRATREELDIQTGREVFAAIKVTAIEIVARGDGSDEAGATGSA